MIVINHPANIFELKFGGGVGLIKSFSIADIYDCALVWHLPHRTLSFVEADLAIGSLHQIPLLLLILASTPEPPFFSQKHIKNVFTQ